MNEQLAVLPEESVAIEETSVVPTGNNEPEGGVVTTLTKQLSVAPATKFTVAPQIFKSVSTVVSVGQVIKGNSRSSTNTLKEQIISL